MTQFNEIREWADKVGIFAKGTAAGQYEKFTEEVLEVEEAMNGKGDLQSEIGDVIVTLVLLSEFKGFSVESAIQAAIDKNNKRIGKGSMVDGVFVKNDVSN